MQPAHTTEDLYRQLAEVGSLAVGRGLVLASGGNLSARLPDSSEFVVTGAGTWLDRLVPEDFTTISLDGGSVVGGTTKPSSEWKLHHRTYLIRPDVNAVIHLHPQAAVLVDAMGEQIRMFTLDHAYYVRSYGRIGYRPNGSDELADEAAEQSREHNAVLMAHHGCSALGPDIGMAFRRAMNFEEAALTTCRALALGDRHTRFPDETLAGLAHS